MCIKIFLCLLKISMLISELIPTAGKIAGVQNPDNIDGISYLPLLKNDMANQQKHKSLYFELHWPTKRGIRVGDWVCLQDKNSEKLQWMKTLVNAAHTPAKLLQFGVDKPKKKKKR